MFHKRLWDKIRAVEALLEAYNENRSNQYHALRADHERLVEALGLTRKVTQTVEYVKKGGPEHGHD